MSDIFPEPIDQAERLRFIREVDHNFSVIAPAGVGKTKAIVDRTIEIATSPHAREWLPRLIVVTYTNRAANEMQQRARSEILRRARDMSVLGHFNRAFFGTIHSFCLKLLRTYGHHFGLPSQLELVQDEEALWLEFIRQMVDVGSALSSAQRERLFKHVRMLQVIQLGRKLPNSKMIAPALEHSAELDLRALLAFPPNNRSKGNVEKGQALLRDWVSASTTNHEFLPLPIFGKGGPAFQELWKNGFAPLRLWLNSCSLQVAHEISMAYRQYRLSQGFVTFDDQVALASELLSHPEAAAQIRREGFRVILDEAQDTDPSQFHVLTELTRPPQAAGNWLENGSHPPRPGHFCMVGDPQQSIYGERANLRHYLKIHEKLSHAPGSAALTLKVTFRCDENIVAQVNTLCAPMLHGRDEQVSFVQLTSRPGATAGQVIRLQLMPPEDTSACRAAGSAAASTAKTAAEPAALHASISSEEGRISESHAAWDEALQIATWLHKQGLEKLRAPSWSEVAILCPRKKWFSPLARALREVGLDFQIQSTNDVKGDQPAFAWFTALLLIASEPLNHFEIVGVLREIFGLSDHELAVFCKGRSALFQIAEPTRGKCLVSETLNLLQAARALAIELPLRDAALHLVHAVNLRDLLLHLPILDYNRQETEDQLEGLLIEAAEAETEGLSLREWAQILQAQFSNPRVGQIVQPNAIQLIGCQKAKGLQWHTVILPFFHRSIRNPSPSYPRVMEDPRNRELHVIFHKDDVPEELSERLKLAADQETQRVLYVALTRARRTLVLVDDSALFPSSTAQRSFADQLLKHAKTSVTTWQELGAKLSADSNHTQATANSSKPEAKPRQETIKLSIEAAAERANDFVTRVLPHSLVHVSPRNLDGTSEEPESRFNLEPGMSAGAFDLLPLYGIWWHETMEKIHWPAGIDEATRTFDLGLLAAPDPKRATREWKLFLQSTLATELFKSGRTHHIEMPILWKKDFKSCIEGIIDLAIHDPEKKSWLVLDWKTNVIPAEKFTDLQARYHPQIEAYIEALKALTQLPARGGIYSTATGLWDVN